MTREGEVRRWLAGRLKMSDVPAATWQLLVDDRYVNEVLDGEDGARERIVRRASLLLRAGRRKHPGRSRPRPPETPRLTRAEREYAETFSACLATHLGAKSPVRTFRGSYLGGRLLTEEEADQFKSGSPYRENLDTVADWLRQHYPLLPWELPDDAETFILTAKIRLRPLEIGVTIGPLAPITLKIMPFVSGRTVERAYRDFQRRLLGQDNRPVQQRGLALLRFVTEKRVTERNRKRDWTRWVKEWNHEQRARPGWQFSEPSAFRRAFLRAERAFLPRDVLNTFLPSTEVSTVEEPARSRRAARR